MAERERTYVNKLSDADKVIVRKVTSGRLVVEFSVQYETLIASRWHVVIRYDSQHGTPHRHIFGSGNSQRKEIMGLSDNNAALTEAERVIKSTFNQIRENYILKLNKSDRSHL